jgi:RNA polymerase sigma-70 factor (ECF subfamily)
LLQGRGDVDYRDVTERRDELFHAAIEEFGRALDRLAAGYEADPELRHDLRQEIHLQLWRSFERFDGRCSLRTWTYRVAHNVAVTYVNRERRSHRGLVGLDQIEATAPAGEGEPDIDRQRALERIRELVRQLKPLDRQILISYLEGMDAAATAEIVGLSPANVRMKIHRIKQVLAGRCSEEKRNA